MGYEVKLDIFEGPLDLLLHLIHKNEVDIFDIPIAVITNQYLAYLEAMQALNMDLAGDFFVMAATLLQIKSKMLLPGTSSEEGDDPLVEITQPLLEYMRFKEAAAELSQRSLMGRDVFPRRTPTELRDAAAREEATVHAGLYDLIRAFKRIVDQRIPERHLRMEPDRWSVKEKSDMLVERLQKTGRLFFTALFSAGQDLAELVVTFLALLELVHAGRIQVFQPDPDSDIQLIRIESPPERPSHG